ncbi:MULTISPECIES: retropepsin-like aspartic protease [Segatella]|nr:MULTISPECIES: retropepsin-like aspartic protease [Segatella]UKK77587.1 retropepsin-like domain-containing protein [Segatella baroniae B14]GJG28149.1 hypothetical protein PRRU23_18490 [Segatella bryantii]SEQ61345.1 Aspartyl protease [Segatella baroniae B14]
MMYTNVTLSHKGVSRNVSALIDTGASVCMIDSTFAVDSCNILLKESNAIIESALGKSLKSISLNLDSLSIGGVSYPTTRCFVVDLVSKLKHHAPKFIIGGDILKKELWCFNLKEMIMTRCESSMKNIQGTLKWKNHEDYSDAFLNSIFLKGKVAGKNTRILFDSGSRRNFLPKHFGVSPTKTIELERGDIAQALVREKTNVCEDVELKIGENNFKLNFIISEEKYPTINAEFLWGKSFVLDYKNKRIYIL